jgi:formate dehydrogenase subunit gamma
MLGRATLPAAGKLNGGQKVNGLLAAAVGFGLAASGIWLWCRSGALVPWIAHLVLFAVWLPAFVGHFYLAVLNPGTRHALRAMFAGDVDLDWARHHHPLWAEQERPEGAHPPSARAAAARVRARPNAALADEQA